MESGYRTRQDEVNGVPMTKEYIMMSLALAEAVVQRRPVSGWRYENGESMRDAE